MELIITLGLALDLLLGEPRWLPHPVIIVGQFIAGAEKFIRRVTSSPQGLRLAGALLTLTLTVGTFFVFWFFLKAAYYFSDYLGFVLSVIFMFQALAVKSMIEHAGQVITALKDRDLIRARQRLGQIVGRNTEGLDEAEISRGAVESVAENTVDGIVAPLFYAFIGGPPLAMAYKVANTLDSMLGYKDENYRHLGWAPAKFDDLVNLIPARLTGLWFLVISPFTRGGFKGVYKSITMDAPGHPSPNGGIPEAAVAGALQVQLGGVNYYGDKPSFRQTMGPGNERLQMKHIQYSLYLMGVATFLTWLAGVLILRLVI